MYGEKSTSLRIYLVFSFLQVIKKASGTQSKTMDKVREQLEDDMEKDIRKRLNKIKTDLLGQHVGDLRSMVETLLNASPSDIITKVFDHCHELFTGMQQKIVNKFLELLVKNRLARDLFQLAVHRGCKSIIGPTAPDTGPNMTQDGGQQEEEKAVQPPPKRTLSLIVLNVGRCQFAWREKENHGR